MSNMESPNDQFIINMAAQCAFDPDAWARFAWDWGMGDLANHSGPRAWQRDINRIIKAHLENSESRFQPLLIAVASGHGIGKSAEMGMLSNWAMSCHTGCKIIVTANTEKQLTTKTSPEVAKWFSTSITTDWFDSSALSIKSADREWKDNWRMDFSPWSENNTEAFAGLHNEGRFILLLMDEASNIADKIWEVAEGALTDENTIIIWIAFGNPTRSTGRFRECFRKQRKYWQTRQIDSRDVEGTNKAYLNQIIEKYGKNSDVAKVRVRGMFPSSSSRQFISTADVDAANGRHLRDEQYKFAPVVLGIDPAWTGEDEFVIYMRQGLYSKLIATYERNDNDVEMAQRILHYEQELKADAVFIDAGHGTGIYSVGKTWGRNWQLVWFAGESLDVGCLNKRAQIWKNLRDWLKEGGAIDPKDTILYDELISPELKPRLDGKIQLESKEDMKKRELSSPNRADALALTFAFPVVANNIVIAQFSSNMVESDYNPYE